MSMLSKVPVYKISRAPQSTNRSRGFTFLQPSVMTCRLTSLWSPYQNLHSLCHLLPPSPFTLGKGIFADFTVLVTDRMSSVREAQTSSPLHSGTSPSSPPVYQDDEERRRVEFRLRSGVVCWPLSGFCVSKTSTMRWLLNVYLSLDYLSTRAEERTVECPPMSKRLR